LMSSSVGRDWLAITPPSAGGFFSGSNPRTDMIAIGRGLELTRIGQVHQSLYNPDLVREELAGDPNGEAREAAQVINLAKVLDSGPASDVQITSLEREKKSTVDVVPVTARVADRGKGIGRIEWRSNGVTVGVASAPNGVGSDYEVKQDLALDPGE